MSDSTKIDRMTQIGGPSHEELREQFRPKTFDQIASELRQKQESNVRDSTLSWGRGGETEETVERGSAAMPETVETAAGVYAEPTVTTPTMPNKFARGTRPDTDHNRASNTQQIFALTNIQGVTFK